MSEGLLIRVARESSEAKVVSLQERRSPNSNRRQRRNTQRQQSS